jgi:hypothetical protein
MINPCILTLWQPYATFVALNLKQYETRHWATRYRGKLVNHSAKRQMDEMDTLTVREVHSLTDGNIPTIRKDYPLGMILSVSDLTDCLEMWDSAVYGPLMPPHRRGIDIQSISALEKAVGNWQEGRFAWKQENTRALTEPLSFRGSQGLKHLTDATALEQINLLLGARAA